MRQRTSRTPGTWTLSAPRSAMGIPNTRHLAGARTQFQWGALRRLRSYACATVIMALLWGCGDLGTRRVPPNAPREDVAAGPEPDAPPAHSSPQSSGEDSLEQDAANALPSDAAPSPQPAERPVRLSTGVALPQSLPSGTAMGFSVEYRFLNAPQSAGRYVWVIRAAGADQPWEQAVQLEVQGQLQAFVPGWQPRQGPFETFIAEIGPDGARRRVSSVESLEQSGR